MIKKLIPLLPQIIASLFLAGFITYAWTEPASAPPGGNVSAPLNVGTSTQNKAGWLTFEGGGTRRDTFLATLSGKVGIGTTNPSEKLEVVDGYIKISGANKGIIFPDGTILRTALFTGRQIFSSSGTFTVPTGVAKVWVTAVGGGGGGGGGGSSIYSAGGGGGGGGAGYSNIQEVSGLSSGQQISITIGSGGGGGLGARAGGGFPGASPGSDGSVSSFGSYVTASGGTGGQGGSSTSGGNGGIIGGQPGQDFQGGFQGGVGGTGGAGGTGYGGYGNGGGGGDGETNINTTPQRSYDGSSGASGVVIVEW